MPLFNAIVRGESLNSVSFLVARNEKRCCIVLGVTHQCDWETHRQTLSQHMPRFTTLRKQKSL